MALNFETWTRTNKYKRLYVWQVPMIRKLFNLWYSFGGFYISGWTPFTVKV